MSNSFKEICNIQLNYNSFSDDVVESFYIPCLEKAIVYKRAVGFFSSNILLQISKGLGAFICNGGKMQLLVSPQLEKRDYEAIKDGYEIKEYITNKIINDFDFDIDFFQKEDRFGMLAYMISSGNLDIKIVALEENNDKALYHEKVGIMKDCEGNLIAFSGSANETYNAYNLNYESIDVFCSWKSDDSEMRCAIKEQSFNRIWNGSAKGLITIPFPEVILNKLLTYKKNDLQRFVDVDKDFKDYLLKKKNLPAYPELNIKLYDYQQRAIEKWINQNFKGIFDMATGTGKTFTAGGAICRLFDLKKRLIVFICCPYTHLVDQWYDEMKNFNIDGIKCYGNINYDISLKRALMKFKQKRTDFVCIIVTNSTFQKDAMQELVKMNLNNTLIIVDEAHNFGADNISKCMNLNYPYRLALSATLDRYGDPNGTAKLYDFFGEKCISYPLEQAIVEGKLTEYYYKPVLVYLEEDEYEKYVEISKQIAKCRFNSNEISDYVKRLLIKRARIIAGAKNKVKILEKIMKNYIYQDNILVYCGAVKYGEYDYNNCSEEKKQIEVVLNMLNKKLNITATKFTSEEDPKLRKEIIQSFKEGNIKALVAIKCLDEGMNIPAIKTAFILASSTNPKEYIQRRGRVLRKSPGKEYAEIYDFITLLKPLKLASSPGEETYLIEKQLARKELSRLIDFANLSKNPSDSNDLISLIRDAYDMDTIMEGENIYE